MDIKTRVKLKNHHMLMTIGVPFARLAVWDASKNINGTIVDIETHAALPGNESKVRYYIVEADEPNFGKFHLRYDEIEII